MKDARVALSTSLVGRPAHDGAEVQLVLGGVRESAERVWKGRVEAVRRHFLRGGAVVEHPVELVGRRVGVHLTQHVGSFLPRHAVHPLLFHLAHRRVCNKKRGGQLQETEKCWTPEESCEKCDRELYVLTDSSRDKWARQKRFSI